MIDNKTLNTHTALNELTQYHQSLLDLINDKIIDDCFFTRIFRLLHDIRRHAEQHHFKEIARATHFYESYTLMLKNHTMDYKDTTKDNLYDYLDWLCITIDELLQDPDKKLDASHLINGLKQVIEDNKNTKQKEDNIVKMLIIEDEEILQDLYEDHFASEYTNIELRQAADGEEGAKILKDESFDLIILDNYMPKKSGLELLHEMRNSYWRNRQTPVVFVSAADISVTTENKHIIENVFIIKKPFSFADIEYFIKMSLNPKFLQIRDSDQTSPKANVRTENV